jgi:hypothetical protein
MGVYLMVWLAFFSLMPIAIGLVSRQPAIAIIPVVFGILVPTFMWVVDEYNKAPTSDLRYLRSHSRFKVFDIMPKISLLAPLGAVLTVPFVNDWLATPLVALLGWMLYISFYLRRGHDGILPLKRPVIHALLRSQRIIPWRFRLFADSAVDRMLLRQVERRYMFWHPLLQEHIYKKCRFTNFFA